jgi:hypothetical protein
MSKEWSLYTSGGALLNESLIFLSDRLERMDVEPRAQSLLPITCSRSRRNQFRHSLSYSLTGDHLGRGGSEAIKAQWMSHLSSCGVIRVWAFQKREGHNYKSMNSEASLSLVEGDCDSGHV